MANTIEWNEALPENTDDASEGALRIREGKKSTRDAILYRETCVTRGSCSSYVP